MSNLKNINPLEPLLYNNHLPQLVYLCENGFLSFLEKTSSSDHKKTVLDYGFSKIFRAEHGKARDFLDNFCFENYKDHPIITDYKKEKDTFDYIKSLKAPEKYLLYFHKKGIDFWNEESLLIKNIISDYIFYFNFNKKGKKRPKALDLVFDVLCYDTNLNKAIKDNPQLLHYAVSSDNKELVEKLIKKGWSAQSFDKEGNPISFYVNTSDMLEYLSQYDPPLINKNDKNKTIVDVVKTKFYEDDKIKVNQVLLNSYSFENNLSDIYQKEMKQRLVGAIHNDVTKTHWVKILKQSGVKDVNDYIKYKDRNASLLGHIVISLKNKTTSLGFLDNAVKSKIAIIKYLIEKGSHLNSTIEMDNRKVNLLSEWFASFYANQDINEFINDDSIQKLTFDLLNQTKNNILTPIQYKNIIKEISYDVLESPEQFLKQAQLLWNISGFFNTDKTKAIFDIFNFIENKIDLHSQNKTLISSLYEELNYDTLMRKSDTHIFLDGLNDYIINNSRSDFKVKTNYFNCMQKMLKELYKSILSNNKKKNINYKSLADDETLVENFIIDTMLTLSEMPIDINSIEAKELLGILDNRFKNYPESKNIDKINAFYKKITSKLLSYSIDNNKTVSKKKIL